MFGNRKVFTIQSHEAWQEAQERGVLKANPDHIDLKDALSQKWIIEMMQKFIFADGAHPIWVWVEDNPELYSHCSLDIDDKAILIEAEVPHERLLVSSYGAWCAGPLQGTYLSHDPRAYERFIHSFGEAAFDKHTSTAQGMIRYSWERIFHLKSFPNGYFETGLDVQGCVEMIPLSAVKSTKEVVITL